MSKYKRWENTIKPKYQIAKGGKRWKKRCLKDVELWKISNFQRPCFHPCSWSLCRQQGWAKMLVYSIWRKVISSEVKIFKYTPLSRLNSYKCCFMFISFSFLFNTIAQLCHKMLLVGLFLFVCLVTCAAPHFLFISLFVCLFTCATSRCVALGTFSTSPSAPLPYLCVQCEFVRYL